MNITNNSIGARRHLMGTPQISAGMPPRMKVMHVVDTLGLGGAERMAVEIANSLHEQKFKVYLCATRIGGPLEGSLCQGVNCLILGRRGRWDFAKMREFTRFVRREGIDIIHSHGRGTMKFVSLCRMLGRLPIRHVFHDHYNQIQVHDSITLDLKLSSKLGVDAYIGVDQLLCDWARKLGIPNDRIHLVRNGVNLQYFEKAKPINVRAEFHIPDNCVVLVMVANFRPEKDHPSLFRALASCRERNRIKLLLIGVYTNSVVSHYQVCLRLIKELGLSDCVIVLGERNDVPRVLAGCDGGILSSSGESGPVVLLEYMAAGLPYVVTDTGEITRAVRNSGTGFTVPAGNPLAMSAAIDRLTTMSMTERQTMGQRGRDLVFREFDVRICVQKICQIYHGLVH